MTKILGTLPAGDDNGLHVIARALVERSDESHVIVAVIRTKKITTDVDTGDVEATTRIERIEVVQPHDLDVAARLLKAASERRHGGQTLPLDMEDEIDALFRHVAREWEVEHLPPEVPAGVDPTTGEVTEEPGEQEGDADGEPGEEDPS